MGFSISWLAIRGRTPVEVRDELAIRSTGEYDAFPDSFLCGADLSFGWYLLFGNRCDFADSQPLEKLSRSGEVVTCHVEEHVMVSGASGWMDGKMIWSITHDSNTGIEHLDAQGELPYSFESIRDQLLAEQLANNDADYLFDIPVEVAKTLTGFRHDEDFPNGPDEPFERLEFEKKWWQSLR